MDWSDGLKQNNICLWQIKDSPALFLEKNMKAGMKFYWKWSTFIVSNRQMSSGVTEGKLNVHI